jgi:ABC-2 type transport system permease protein
MVGASLYVIGCSAKNRILVRLRRLREPRYLVGAIVGVAYLYFAVFLPRRAGEARGRRRNARPPRIPPIVAQVAPSLAAAGLLLGAALVWLFPVSSHLLDFTEAETELLVPAPVSRRQLILYRLMRSQLRLIFAAAASIFFVSVGTMTISAMVLRTVTLWIVFLTMRIYFAGVTMARAHLAAPEPRSRRAAWVPLAVSIAAVATVAVPVVRALPGALNLPMPEVVSRLHVATTAGVAGVVLLPFRALLQPLFADGARDYLAAMPGALLVLLVTLAWVLKSDGVFQEAADVPVASPAPATGRRRAAPRVRAAGWELPLAGRPETAFMWKNGMQTLRGVNVRSLMPAIVGLVLAVFGLTAALSETRSRGIAAALCTAALLCACAAVLIGPLTINSDLRGDLRHMELLKTWPVKGGALIRGEMLWPAVLLTACAWIALVCGTVLSAAAFPRLTLVWRASLGTTAAIMIPAFVFAQYTVHQTAAVLFPAWIPTSNDMRGFDSMGQRLLMFAGVLLGVVVIVGPGAIAGGIVGFAFYRLTASPLVFVPAAAVCVAIVSIEVLMATESLGPAYERIDLAGVERGE